MNGVCLLLMPIFWALCDAGTIEVKPLPAASPKNFKHILDWTYGIHKFIQTNPDVYKAEIERALRPSGLFRSANPDFGLLYPFFSDLAAFRSVVVNTTDEDEMMDVVFSENATENVYKLLTAFLPLHIHLYELQSNIEKWENGTDALRGSEITRIGEGEALQWFKDNGFKEEQVRNTTFARLRREMDKFYDSEKSFGEFQILYAIANFPGSTLSQRELLDEALPYLNE